jgi:hypothetical protein
MKLSHSSKDRHAGSKFSNILGRVEPNSGPKIFFSNVNNLVFADYSKLVYGAKVGSIASI